MQLKDTGLEGVDCVHLAQDRNQWQACEHKKGNVGAINVRGQGKFLA